MNSDRKGIRIFMDKFTNYLDDDIKEVYLHYKKYIIDDNPVIHLESFSSDILNQIKSHDYEGFRLEKIGDFEKALYHQKVAHEFLILYAMLPNVIDANHHLAMTYFSIARISLLKEDHVDFEYYYMEFLSATLQALLDLKHNPYLLDEINFLKDKVEDLFRFENEHNHALFEKLKHITEEVFKEFHELAEVNLDFDSTPQSIKE